jgi:hypothetical protein
MIVLTSSEFREGFAESIRAATPATCGLAIEVPLNDAYVSFQTVDRMSTPGATTLICGPKFENGARASVGAVAPTAITPG